MRMYRMLPPAGGATTKVFNRTYSAAAGVSVSGVPEFDADMLESNGWIKSSSGGSGTTAERPATPRVGHSFYDSTLGVTVVFDGRVWRNSTTAASV